MNFRKSTLALALALAYSTAHGFEKPNAPIARSEVVSTGEVQLGQNTAGLALDPVTHKAFVSNYNDGTLSIVDTVDPEAAAVTLAVGGNPRRLVHNAAMQRTYVVNDTTPGTVTVVDASANAVIATIPVGKRPRNIAADFPRGEIYVSNLDSNTMSVISTDLNAVIATINVGSSPFMGDVDPLRGRIYVVSAVDRVVHIIDRATKTVFATFNTGRSPNAATVDQRTGKVYVNNVGDSTVTVYDSTANTLKLIGATGSGSTANFGSVSAIYRHYYLPNANDYTVTVIDTDTDEIVKAIPVGASPQQVVIDGSDGNAYVVNRLDNSVSVIDARTDSAVDSFKVGVNPWRISQGMDHVFTLNENGNRFDSLSIAKQANALAGTAVATEWYHSDFDHYFHTVGEVENRLIGDGLYRSDWSRTMEFFRVWTEDGPGRVGVCRFYTEAFGAKSSHFYTPSGAECDGLKAGDVWKFEEMSYFVELPNAAGACGKDTMPLYRAYNNGMGGAPNHRLTTSKAARDALVATGWIVEGTGDDGVVACVPSLRGDEL